MSKQDPPFKGKLRRKSKRSGVIIDETGVVIASAYDLGTGLQSARADRIIHYVNAHDKLVAVATEYRALCVIAKSTAERNGYDVLASSDADDIREIDAALENKEP